MSRELRGQFMDPPIFDAVRDRNYDKVARILSLNPAQASTEDEGGNRPLHWAGDLRIAELLIRIGADVNARGWDGMTPLHFATKYGRTEVIPVLIAHGADIEDVHELGWSPLTYAITAGFPEGPRMVDLLLRAGANYDLYAAVARADIDRVQVILASHPDELSRMPINKQDELLTQATQHKSKNEGGVGSMVDRVQVIDLLFEHGLRLDEKALRFVLDNYAHDEPIRQVIRKRL
jgi:ankyrin repeat protein